MIDIEIKENDLTYIKEIRETSNVKICLIVIVKIIVLDFLMLSNPVFENDDPLSNKFKIKFLNALNYYQKQDDF
ncbi:hypothetical protein BpHYR1_019119 [Brachionus plicatilis]|uniref:Uncharacterized protein n=1 Tax=Brachionus plicatilis TaxID=10195 RepID=A0A3M7SDN5_BRAPC|nr:hypothetical protein BpHYR1_019119 [Brachionus plicatilis]